MEIGNKIKQLLHISKFNILHFSYCWIDTSQAHNITAVTMEFVLFYGPIWICILYNIIVYIVVFVRAKRMGVSNIKK